MSLIRTSNVATYLSKVFLVDNFGGEVCVGGEMENPDYGGSAVYILRKRKWGDIGEGGDPCPQAPTLRLT